MEKRVKRRVFGEALPALTVAGGFGHSYCLGQVHS